MKKIAASLLLLLFITHGYSQIVLLDDNNSVVSNTIIDINLASNSSSTKEILIKNAGAVTDTLKALRIVYTIDANDQTQFCFGGLCYSYSTDISNLTLTVNPGDTIDYAENGFHALFSSGAACITRTVHYRFYNVNNFSDSAGVTLRYVCATDVDDLSKPVGTISNAYPNPASSTVSLKYTINASSEKGKIIFRDMLGKSVKEVMLNDKQGVAKISITDLTPGIYFYTYTIDDKAISSKKLVITY